MLVQKLAPQILEEIKKAKKILLHCHPSPDSDSVGGSLAMMHVLQSMNKEVVAIRGDSEVPVSFSVLPGFEKLAHKNFFEIDLEQFDLFIILDSGGLNQVSRVAPVVFPTHLKTVSIDHHATSQNFATINLIDPSYPATCQILYDLFVLWHVDLTPDMAKCLMLGIYADTGGFKFPKTSGATFEAAAHLAKIAPDYTAVIDFVDNSNTPGVVAFEALALSSVSLYCKNKLAVSAVSYDALHEKKISKGEIYPDIANTLKSVIGWEIGVKIVEDQPAGVRASFRTRDSKKYNVAKIAAALGGGGHEAAAGVYMKMSLDEAVKKVVETASVIYPELR
jgi:phosphoesterase RecJ-like protein